MKRLAVAVLALGVLATGTAYAQQGGAARPSEQDMFGGGDTPSSPDGGATTTPNVVVEPPRPAPPGPTTAPPAATAAGAAAGPPLGEPADRDTTLLGGGATPEHLSDYQAPENPLAIGGQLYLRASSLIQQGQPAELWTLTAPNLLDVYGDARPNPRVRAFVLARTFFDPTAAPGSGAVTQLPAGSGGGALGSGSATAFSSVATGRGPTTFLDQMWIRFDIKQRVFVTAGKQHVRWGTGRFWQPTDYLHLVKRNPLDVFDARPGATMLKLHVPWEDKGWNFYGFAVYEDPNESSARLSQIAGGARAEIILFDTEIGLDILAKRGHANRYGIDFSRGIWDFDVYGDIGIRAGEDFCTVFANDGAAPAPNPGGACPAANVAPVGLNPDVAALASMYSLKLLSGTKVQAVGGINWAHKYNDNDLFTVGAEYFYNQPGYPNANLYPGLLFNSNFTPILNFFYTGRQYAAVFASFPAPYSWNLSTFTLSTLANISDVSFVSRLDYAYTLLTHLSFEAFVGVHYGNEAGEFRLGANLAGFQRDPNLIDLGVALRVKL